MSGNYQRQDDMEGVGMTDKSIPAPKLTQEQLELIAAAWSTYRGATFYPFDVEKMLALAGELAGVGE